MYSVQSTLKSVIVQYAVSYSVKAETIFLVNHHVFIFYRELLEQLLEHFGILIGLKELVFA